MVPYVLATTQEGSSELALGRVAWERYELLSALFYMHVPLTRRAVITPLPLVKR